MVAWSGQATLRIGRSARACLAMNSAAAAVTGGQGCGAGRGVDCRLGRLHHHKRQRRTRALYGRPIRVSPPRPFAKALIVWPAPSCTLCPPVTQRSYPAVPWCRSACRSGFDVMGLHRCVPVSGSSSLSLYSSSVSQTQAKSRKRIARGRKQKRKASQPPLRRDASAGDLFVRAAARLRRDACGSDSSAQLTGLRDPPLSGLRQPACAGQVLAGRCWPR